MIVQKNQHQKDAVLLHAIHNILLKQWDPLRIQRIPAMRDEYEDYLPYIFKLLNSQASTTEIFEYLWWVEQKVLEKAGNRDHSTKVAHALRALIEQS